MSIVSQNKLYKTWKNMIYRCHRPADKDYRYYGGRGIVVCDRWKNSFLDFLDDMGDRPSPAHTIDRKDVNGNYSPDNCFWATRQHQSRNQRLRVDNKSGYSGIYKRGNSWRAVISVNSKKIYIGSYRSKEDAIDARREAEKKYW